MSFKALGLCDELVKTVEEQGYASVSPVQEAAIPAVLRQQDVLAIAQTGTGKTAAYTLPLLQLLSAGKNATTEGVRSLIITPTRELAAQVLKSVETYSRQLNISNCAVFGGVRIEPQIAELKSSIDVLIATPGRLIDLYNQGAVHFEQLEVLVLDEADRMLELGFISDIEKIQTLLAKKKQTLLFSATFSDVIKAFAKQMLHAPIVVESNAVNSAVESVKQTVYSVNRGDKKHALVHLIRRRKWSQALVFVRTKRGADTLVTELKNAGISAESIHANRTQHARTLALSAFENAQVKILVATDIAARGIHVSQLPCVINFDLPYVPEDYVHRIGRTGRAGNTGEAVSFCSEDEVKQLQSIERVTGRQFKLDVLPGFEAKALSTSGGATNAGSATKATSSGPLHSQPSSGSKMKKSTGLNAEVTKGKRVKGKSRIDEDDDLYGNFEATTQFERRGPKSTQKQKRKR